MPCMRAEANLQSPHQPVVVAGCRSLLVMVSPVMDTGKTSSTDTSGTPNQSAVQDLLDQCKEVFDDIQGMPPVREHIIYHTIPLEEGTYYILPSLC